MAWNRSREAAVVDARGGELRFVALSLQ